jgi:hypothetical protein
MHHLAHRLEPHITSCGFYPALRLMRLINFLVLSKAPWRGKKC